MDVRTCRVCRCGSRDASAPPSASSPRVTTCGWPGGRAPGAAPCPWDPADRSLPALRSGDAVRPGPPGQLLLPAVHGRPHRLKLKPWNELQLRCFRYMTTHGLGVAPFCRMAGVKPNTFRAWVTNKGRAPSRSTLAVLAGLLDISEAQALTEAKGVTAEDRRRENTGRLIALELLAGGPYARGSGQAEREPPRAAGDGRDEGEAAPGGGPTGAGGPVRGADARLAHVDRRASARAPGAPARP